MMVRRFLALLTCVPLLLATDCPATGSFYIANLSPQPLRVEYTSRCAPCFTPKLMAVADLKQARDLSFYTNHQQPAPVDVRGRTDSVLTYSISLPSQFALLMFERGVDGGPLGSGNADPERDFADVQVRAETSDSAVTYGSSNARSVLRRWHKFIYVIELH